MKQRDEHHGSEVIVDGAVRWQPPAPALWDPVHQEPAIQLSRSSRIVVRRSYCRGILVDYAVMHDGRHPVSREWLPIVRIDCRHNEVHKHTFIGPEKRDVIRPVASQRDIDDTCTISYTAVHDQWEENERRWLQWISSE